jgi:PHS family inorganic phosphate transporter-like MFS transporter
VLTRTQESKRRKWALKTIDEAPFQIWVVVVAGVGFLTDAFDIFALNVVTPMLGYVYWPDHRENGVPEVPKAVGTAMLCATLAGTMVGQVAFGFAADVLGRRKMYGLELVIVIVGTMLMILSSNGEKNSMAIGGWLITWRVVMGLGIGADYPLSAVITSEFAPRKYRARMLSWVFFAQPIGQLLANVLSFAAVAAFQDQITNDETYCTDDSCIRAVDRLWRLVVGIGIIPAVIALAFRFTIPESPRYKLDVLRNGQAVVEDTQDYYGGPQVDAEGGELDVLESGHVARTTSRQSSSSSDIAPDDVIDSDGEDDVPAHGEFRHDSAHQVAEFPPTDPMFVPPLASRTDAKKFFFQEGNWVYLLGTSLSWFFLDFAFYGLGLSSPEIVRHIWKDPKTDTRFVYDSLHDNSLQLLIMISIGATIGGAAMIKVIKYASPKAIQFWGFIALFALFVVTGAAWPRLLGNNTYSVGLIVLYVLCQIAFNLGPNVTTFIVSNCLAHVEGQTTDRCQIPAEIFPTRYRCTCHGISAAAGKFGSWVAQIFLAYTHWAREDFGYVLLVMSAFMMAGAVTTYFLVPETRDHDNKSRTLEVLAGGRVVLEELNRQRAREQD